MTTKKSICVITTFILISCGGGGGGGGTIETLETSSSNTATPLLTETCSLYIDTTYRCEFTHNGLERFYFIQENHPESSGLSSVLFVLHGYGSTALRIRNYSSFNSLANTKENNFILIHPQGAPMNTSLASSSSHWNSGGWTIGSDVDDVDFIDSIINLVSKKYNINNDRIYSTGMSNGGFMSYHLACNLSTKIAAVASVTGSISSQTLDDCSPQHSTSILQIHGTLDATVPYDGNSSLGMESVDDLINYWKNYNLCDLSPIITTINTINPIGSYRHDKYSNCLNGVSIELYKIEGMGHTWPFLSSFGISATEKIWEFINTYDMNGKIN